MIRKAIIAGALIAAAGAGIFVVVSRRSADAQDAWRGCLGKPVADCTVPVGYDPILRPCVEYLDCRTTPAAAEYASATETDIPGGVSGGRYRYAVLGLDAQGRIVQVEIKTFFAVP